MGVQVPPPTRIKVLVRAVGASQSGFVSPPPWYRRGHRLDTNPSRGVSKWTPGGLRAWPRTWAGEESPGSSGSISRSGADGKRRQRRIGGFATEREARRALAQTKVDIDTGRLRYGPRRTVADLASEWLEAVRPNRKASTFSNYGWLMRAYVVPRIGPVRLDRLTPADIQKLYSELRSSGGQGGKPLSGTQVHNIHGVLHNALSYAVRMGYMARNPSEAIDKPRLGHRGATGLHTRPGTQLPIGCGE